MHNFRMKTSRSRIDPVYPAFRVERSDRNGQEMWDIIYQANGPEEAIHILVDERDLKDLVELLTPKTL